MTHLLEQAIAQLREFPEDEQDALADVIFAYLSQDEHIDRTDDREPPSNLSPLP